MLTATTKPIPGGCPDCNANQTLTQDNSTPSLWHLTIHHDETCPNYKQMKEAR